MSPDSLSGDTIRGGGGGTRKDGKERKKVAEEEQEEGWCDGSAVREKQSIGLGGREGERREGAKPLIE